MEIFNSCLSIPGCRFRVKSKRSEKMPKKLTAKEREKFAKELITDNLDMETLLGPSKKPKNH